MGFIMHASGTSNLDERIRSGWTVSTLAVVLTLVLALGIVAAVGRWATTHSPISTSGFGWTMLLTTVLIVAIASVTVFFSFVREVDLSSRRAVFHVGMRRVAVGWNDLVPPRAPCFITIVFWYRRDGVVQEKDALVLDRRLARAILQYQSCPRFDLDSKIWTSLGIISRS